MSGEAIEQYVNLAERLIWSVTVFAVALMSYIRNHKK
jgi:hypothetical protein